MNKIALLSTLSFALLTSFGAQAADTAELKVKGVIRPSACSPSFTGDGVVDYGTIPAKSLNATTGTLLPAKTIPFAITCDGPTRIALRTIDNRASSMVTGLTPVGNAYGLGAYQGKSIGAYNILVTPGSFTADGSPADVIFEYAGGGSWGKAASGNLGNTRHSFAPVNTTVPGAYKTITGVFTVQAAITKSSDLPTTETIPLDGSATIEVQYL